MILTLTLLYIYYCSIKIYIRYFYHLPWALVAQKRLLSLKAMSLIKFGLLLERVKVRNAGGKVLSNLINSDK